jgi:hypothetical protein
MWLLFHHQCGCGSFVTQILMDQIIHEKTMTRLISQLQHQYGGQSKTTELNETGQVPSSNPLML